jgi:hypothetical protein
MLSVTVPDSKAVKQLNAVAEIGLKHMEAWKVRFFFFFGYIFVTHSPLSKKSENKSITDLSLVVEVSLHFSFFFSFFFLIFVLQHLTDEQIRGISERARQHVPLSKHAFVEESGRHDPVALLLEQEVLQRREPDLLPLRHGRMMFSPFTFYRGAARIMAHDLIRTPQSTLTHQWICGDAHLCNFGMFASRERTLVFDMNDFDETAIGPFEWDVKRLAASFIIAGQNNQFDPSESELNC